MTATQEQLAALAALVVITPETHPLCFPVVCHICGSIDLEQVEAGGAVSLHCQCGGWQLAGHAAREFRSPTLDTPAGDDVFLAPTLRWLVNVGGGATVGGTGSKRVGTIYYPEGIVKSAYPIGSTFIAALIAACQSAGVPEIVAIFGEAQR